MKLKLDRDNLLSRVETVNTSASSLILEKEAEGTEILNTSIQAFKNHYKGTSFQDDILNKIGTKEVTDLKTARKQAEEITILIKSDIELKLKFKPDFIEALKYLKIENLYLQKAYYELEEGEDIVKVVNALKNSKSDAFFKSYKIEDNNLVVYSTTNGLWNIEEKEYIFGKIQTNGSNIRPQVSIRKLSEPTEKIADFKKVNFPLFEDAKAILSNKAVDNLYKSFENKNMGGVWDDDKVAYYLKEYHLNYNLDDEEVSDILINKSVIEEAKKEGSHIGKGSASLKDSNEMISDNSNNIKTDYSKIVKQNVKIDTVLDEIEKIKNESISEFLIRQQEELIEKQKKELEEQRVAIIVAKKELPKAIDEFYTSLKNGNGFEHSLNNIKASKYNEFTIKMVFEEVKADVLLSEQKDQKINILSNEKEFYVKESEERFKTIQEKVNEVNKLKIQDTTNKNTIKDQELKLNEFKEKTIQLVHAFRKLEENHKELSAELAEKNITIVDLNEEIANLNQEIEEKDNEINDLTDVNTLLENTNTALSTTNAAIVDANTLLSDANKDLGNQLEQSNNINTELSEKVLRQDVLIFSLRKQIENITLEQKELMKQTGNKFKKKDDEDNNLEIESIMSKYEIASNPETPIEILEQLANDEDEMVRWGVASNPETPIEILEQLAEDESEMVRFRVSLLGKNDNTQLELDEIRKIFDDLKTDTKDTSTNTSTDEKNSIKRNKQ